MLAVGLCETERKSCCCAIVLIIENLDSSDVLQLMFRMRKYIDEMTAFRMVKEYLNPIESH